jgi:hypothetical protein
MNLEKLLAQKPPRAEMGDLIIDSYPHESARMFKREKNAFITGGQQHLPGIEVST